MEPRSGGGANAATENSTVARVPERSVSVITVAKTETIPYLVVETALFESTPKETKVF